MQRFCILPGPTNAGRNAETSASRRQLREHGVHPLAQPVHRALELTRRGARRRLLARDAVDAHAHDRAAEVQAPPRELPDDLGLSCARRPEHAPPEPREVCNVYQAVHVELLYLWPRK